MLPFGNSAICQRAGGVLRTTTCSMVAYQLKGGVNSTRPRRKIRLAATRFVGASSRRLRRRRRQAPAPAASSAKCAVPRPQILARIAVIEHSTRAASALLRLLPPPPPPPPPPPLPRPQRAACVCCGLAARALLLAARAPQGRSTEQRSVSRYFP